MSPIRGMSRVSAISAGGLLFGRRAEIHEVLLEAFRVLGPCHLVDAGRGELLQPEEARPQNIDGEMMQERR